MAKKENHMGFMSKLLSFGSDKDLKRYYKIVDQINGLEPQFEKMTEEELRGQTDKFRERYANGESLDDMLPEAFATVREASKRTMGMRHFDVQLIGAMALHEGHIAEMKTGEGKTLVSTLAGYLNAIAGKGVHVVTVNDYLAKRDSEWMGRIYKYLGMTVGLLQNNMPLELKRPAYQADVTYGTNSEFGFDYLRDNMVTRPEQRVQRGHNYAIVDEVDSILIDEARTPLIISGAGTKSASTYKDFARAVRGLERGEDVSHDMLTATEDVEPTGDYVMDEAKHTIAATERGLKKIERRLGIDDIYADLSGQLVNHLQQALKAQYMFHRDKQYVVTNGEVKIVDEFTGRIMEGRRYSEGLHQAIEAKEGVTVAGESKTLATITFQNFFRLYGKLSGMTGTALTEEEEFSAIYNLDVVEIPTNRPVVRIDHPDVVYKTEAGKFRAIIRQVKECHEKGQPVLVGTISIEKSEILSKLLKREGIPHSVLNAKHHEQEAQIVAQAGKLGAVTIATNMAGRGTDIMLGGNADFLAKAELARMDFPGELLQEADSYAETDDPEILKVRHTYEELLKKHKAAIAQEAEQVRAAGGLFIIGTERHESRRIDNQLRGRSGRQGDPGETRFYLSMQDDIMRLFGSERIMNMMETLGIDEDTPIDAKILSGAIENAQKTVEGRNFQSRKNVLEYDDVMNVQRKIIYEQRRQVLDGEDLQKNIQSMMRFYVDTYVASAFGEQPKLADKQHFFEMMTHFEPIFFPTGTWLLSDEELAALTREQAEEKILSLMQRAYAKREEQFTSPVMREIERVVTLRVVDEFWMDHIDAMDDLRQGIRLRAYAQTDPVIEYKREGFDMFEAMNDAIKEEIVRRVFLVRIKTNEEIKRQRVAKVTGEGAGGDKTVKRQPVVKKIKVGPNDPCPCGSGKKYKKCCRDKDLAAERGQNAN